MSTTQDELRESRDLFLAESGDYLELLNSELLKIEKSQAREAETESINNMFRAAHSIKGMSGMMGYMKINRLTHKMENIMDNVRQGKQALTDFTVEVLFKCFDYLTALIGAVSQDEPDDESVDIEEIIITIDDIMAGKTPAAAAAADKQPEPAKVSANSVKQADNSSVQITLSISDAVKYNLGEFDDLNLFIAERSPDNIYEISIDIEKDCYLKYIKPEVFIESLKEYGDVIFSSPDFKTIQPIDKIDFEVLDIKLYIVYQTAENIDILKAKLQNDQINIRDLRLPAPALPESPAEAGNKKAEISSYLGIFIEETNEEIETMNLALLALEKVPGDIENINTIMRVMHSIKSSAAALGYSNISNLAHATESLILAIKNNRHEFTSELITTLLHAIDEIKNILGLAKKDGSGDNVDLSECISKIKDIAAFYENANSPHVAEPVKKNAAIELKLTEYENAIISEAFDNRKKVYVLRFKIDFDCPMKAMRYLLLTNNYRENGDIIKIWPENENIFEKDNLNEIIIIYATIEENAEKIKRLGDIDQVNEIIVSPFSFDDSQFEVKGESLAPQPKAGLLNGAGQPEAKVMAAAGGEVLNVKTQEAAQVSVTAASRATAAAAPPAAGAGADHGDMSQQTLRVDLSKLDNLINLIGELVIIKANFFQISNQLNKTFLNKKLIFKVEDNIYNINRQKEELGEQFEILEKLSEIAHLTGCSYKKTSAAEQLGDNQNVTADSLILSLRLNNQKMMSFFDGLTEALQSMQAEIKNIFKNENYIIDLNTATYKLGKIINSLQTGIMDTRMVPVGQLFRRFQRVVRDLAKAQNKKINLDIFGEETELDKKVIDELGNPLTHIIRNSVDHAVEAPEERVRNQKPDTGTISLNAYHEGSNICIEVKDDGRGISSEKVLKKAIERGIISEIESAGLTRQEIINLIFMPGFSTAEKVTDISGRGVGMDIVKKSVETLKGSIAIFSEEGAGTRITIRLPLTLAIISALLIRIKNAVFSIPLESVLEIIKCSKKDMFQVEGKMTVKLRNKILSIVELADMIQVEQRTTQSQNLTIVVIASATKMIGICVDELIGKEEIVIKSLSDDFKKVEGISGASVLGDGTVSLILDVPSIIRRAMNIE